MVVLEKKLSKLYKDIDMVTTPTGKPVAMVHCNNGSSEIDKWFHLFKGLLKQLGVEKSDGELYQAIFCSSLSGSPDCSDILYYNYLSGEPVTGLMEGCPMLLRAPSSDFSFENFTRSQLYSVLASLALGNRVLQQEHVVIRKLMGHGGYFKTPGVGQHYLSAAMKAPVTILSTAGEGGPYGMAVLASFRAFAKGEKLEDYLEQQVFAHAQSSTYMANEEEIAGYEKYLNRFAKMLDAERKAVELS